MAKDKSLTEYPQSYVVLDIETTGLDAYSNEIIEISAIKVLNGNITETFSKLIKPTYPISDFITELTGITQEMLNNAERIETVLLEMQKFIGHNIIIGHNVTFDIGFINTKLQKHLNTTLENDFVDTLKIAKKLLPDLKSRKLGIIAQHFNLPTEGMHRGLKDCEVTNTCYQKFLEMLNLKTNQLSLI